MRIIQLSNGLNTFVDDDDYEKLNKYKWHGGGGYGEYIRVNGKRIHLGYYDNISEAAKAYNKSASYHYGKFAKLNILVEKAA